MWKPVLLFFIFLSEFKGIGCSLLVFSFIQTKYISFYVKLQIEKKKLWNKWPPTDDLWKASTAGSISESSLNFAKDRDRAQFDLVSSKDTFAVKVTYTQHTLFIFI